MSPIVLNETSVKPFCFYLDGNLCKGVSYQNRLYHLVETLNAGNLERVREICLDLRRQKLTCIITRTEHHYRIWTDLRAMQVGTEVAKPVLPVSFSAASELQAL
ncbi:MULTISPECIES: hypothetical protein [unclassified Leptolyngbya]|uniref:hypothetical protein n=1 Tax=unclassified Leptolyngbya TaxID=2650499 RepID=UPI0016878EDE|nr:MULTISPECIES: hypothetical protein [unclassified Leptolyngbya]MBD1913031.1 hypothetical protein [Leptolyngbya sp. FACHB-8]MBD2154468.1 hypothetical protein [Leptolyngbya sp. FACHB-16]